ncbi:hypothetical protein PQ676_07440 [Rickettsia felis]|nr:hypothetical protein [Rickettsia felis]MDE8612023.1 hypothetical protein [Rickettsia felis]
MNTNAIKEVISRINAGTIDIDVGKAATFVGSLLKAANGSIKADVLHLLNSSAEIVTQQGRIKELVGWVGKSPNENNLPQNVKEELAIITRSKDGDKSNKPPAAPANNVSNSASLMPGGNSNDDDPFAHFKKKDGSNHYECEKFKSPEWNKA